MAYNSGYSGVVVYQASNPLNILLVNCILVNNAYYGIERYASPGNSVRIIGVAFYNNASGDIQSGLEVFEPVSRISLTDDPFVDPDNGDFRLNRTARALLGAGFPQRFLVDGDLSSWSGFPDIGAVLSGRGIGDVGEYGNHWSDIRRTYDGG